MHAMCGCGAARQCGGEKRRRRTPLAANERGKSAWGSEWKEGEDEERKGKEGKERKRGHRAHRNAACAAAHRLTRLRGRVPGPARVRARAPASRPGAGSARRATTRTRMAEAGAGSAPRHHYRPRADGRGGGTLAQLLHLDLLAGVCDVDMGARGCLRGGQAGQWGRMAQTGARRGRLRAGIFWLDCVREG